MLSTELLYFIFFGICGIVSWESGAAMLTETLRRTYVSINMVGIFELVSIFLHWKPVENIIKRLFTRKLISKKNDPEEEAIVVDNNKNDIDQS
jgi:hypothetical protein